MMLMEEALRNAFDLGWAAWEVGNEDNPYEAESGEWFAWNDGWSAHDDAYCNTPK